jgi:hypothetical protein
LRRDASIFIGGPGPAFDEDQKRRASDGHASSVTSTVAACAEAKSNA